MSKPALTLTQIPCCLCGTYIFPNAANQCPTCLAQDFDLQERLQRGPGGAPHTTIYQCRECRKYLRTEKQYDYAEPESPQLLALCLKHIPALQQHHHSTNNSNNNSQNTSSVVDSHSEMNTAKLHIVDAKWIWTEPHSMRLKIHLTVRTELCSVPVQQRCSVELYVAWKQCPECKKEYTSRQWHAIVQVRQKQAKAAYDAAQPKKGLAVLEQAIADAGAAHVRQHVLQIDNTKQGFDFYFNNLAQAQSFVGYLQTIVPIRVKTSSKLVSTDSHNNTAHMKHTLTADIVPLLRHDLLLIHKATPKASLAGKLALVLQIGSGTIQLHDASPKRPNSGKKGNISNGTSNTDIKKRDRMELSAEAYYKNEKYYTVLQSSNRLIRFVVLDIELCDTSDNKYSDDIPEYKGPASGVQKYALADVEVARESDMGVNDDTFRCVTHLGHLINAGDIVLGYDLASSTSVMSTVSNEGNWADGGALQNNYVCPDVVLVRKVSSPGDEDDPMLDDTATASGSVGTTNTADDDEHDGTTAGKRMSKKKQRRRARQGSKRRAELRESAARMGLIDELADDVEPNFDSELVNDPDMAEQLSTLEEALESTEL